MPNTDSKNRNIRHMRQINPVIGLYEFMTTMKINIVPDKATPTIQANFFCFAPTYSGTWFLTIKRPMIKEGEYFGLTKTRIIKSVRKRVIEYFARTKSLLYRMRIRDIKI